MHRSLDKLSEEEFKNDVHLWWGNRPFWFGVDKASLTGRTEQKAYWVIITDWAEPEFK